MAYNEHTTNWFRRALEGTANITEKRMMGGMCFFFAGNMIGGADQDKAGAGRYMFRLGIDNQALGESLPGGELVVQGGRLMRGFFFVREEVCDEEELAQWLNDALTHAQSLPPK